MNIYISKSAVLSALLLFLFTNSFAQGFKVKEFKQNINDGSAFHAPLDADGHPCGLIKIQTDKKELKFRGDIVGEVENKTNEFWVFMAPESKQLNILHPNFLPLFVDFNTYGIEISSKTTYILTLSEQKYNKEKSGLIATVKPETAAFYIDDVFIENLSGNGLYQLYLPKGDHICRMEQRGYRPNVQVVTTGKGTQNLNVEMESVLAGLEVKCKTGTAEIYVDGELKGNGTWKGSIIAGEHQIEARQQNFETSSQTISIEEKESRTFVVPELKRSMGKIIIESIPSNMPIEVDGKYVGLSPCTLDVESGRHYVRCKTYGCKPYRSDIEVNAGEINKAIIKIEFEGSGYEAAYSGDGDAIIELAAFSCLPSVGNYEEAIFWINRHPQGESIVKNWEEYGKQHGIEGYWQHDWILAYCKAGNPEKALELYSIERKNEDGIVYFPPDFDIGYIGDSFLMKKEYDKAIQCFEKADEYGYEGLGDCYVVKGNKGAVQFFRGCLPCDNCRI